MSELKDKHQFCKCNNCDEVFFDTNPSEQPFFKIPKNKGFRELSTLQEEEEEGDFFQGCPECETDEFLQDVVDENELCS